MLVEGIPIGMEPQSNRMYFSNLLESDLNLDEQSMLDTQYHNQNANANTQETEVTLQMRSTSKKQQRGGNFSIEEDKVLVSAWLNISMDPIHGNDQKKATFWQKVKEFIDESKQFDFNRTENSLMNRWSAIQLATNKFCSCYAKVESLNQSGTNDDDKIFNAKHTYKELYGSTFQFEHCWLTLKNKPKWFVECEKKNHAKRPRKGVASSPCTPDSVNLGEDDVVKDNFVDLDRPPGKKAEKERLTKGKNKESTTVSQISGALNDIKEFKSKLVEKKMEMLEKAHAQEQEKIRIKQEMLEMKQFKEDERIMMMVLSGLSKEQQEFYTYRQREILRKRKRD